MSRYADAVTRTFYNNETFLSNQFRMLPLNATTECYLKEGHRLNSASYGNMAYLALHAPKIWADFWKKELKCCLTACRMVIAGCRPVII